MTICPSNVLRENNSSHCLEFAPQMIDVNNVNALNSVGDDKSGTGGGETDPNTGGILAAICAAFCKDNALGQQFGLNQTNATAEVPITSQSKCNNNQQQQKRSNESISKTNKKTCSTIF